MNLLKNGPLLQAMDEEGIYPIQWPGALYTQGYARGFHPSARTISV